jgi:hypothetical protein
MIVGPTAQKLIALSLLALTAFGTWAGVISPVMDRFDQYERSANQSQLLISRYQRILGSSAALKSEIAAIKKNRVLKDGLLVASSAQLGAAILQGKIKGGAAAGTAELISIQVLAPKPEADFTRVAVRARIKGNISALQIALYGLETAWPSLLIDNVSIRARTRRSRKVKGEPATLTVESNLNIRFDARGYMARKKAGPANGSKGAGK